MKKEGLLILNYKTNLDLNLRLTEYPSIPIANEEYEEVYVEGRNGNLIINKGTYPNINLPFNFTILSEQIDVDFDKVYEWLTEIKDNRLIWGRDDRCYIVKKVIFDNLQKEFKSIGEFSCTFICEPFKRDLKQITTTVTNGEKIYYPGNAPSEPLIKIYGSGNIQITINGETMQINNVTNYVEIDSELMQVRNADKTSKDMDTLGDFALLSKGENAIAYTGTITSVEINYYVRWK